MRHRAVESFTDARTVNGAVCQTFQDAAIQLGLFGDQNEAQYAMQEAVETLYTPRQIRILFVHLLVNDCVTAPIQMWEDFKQSLALDLILQNNGVETLGFNMTLEEIDHHLEEYGKTLGSYGLPNPEHHMRELIHEMQRWGRNQEELGERADAAVARFNQGQRAIYDRVMAAVANEGADYLFVDGKAGTGKTTVVKAICDKIRSMGKIVLPTATSAFAAQLYPGGRTTHATFKVNIFSNVKFTPRLPPY